MKRVLVTISVEDDGIRNNEKESLIPISAVPLDVKPNIELFKKTQKTINRQMKRSVHYSCA